MMSKVVFTITLLFIWHISVAESSYNGEDLLATAVDILNHLVTNKHCSSSHRACPDSWVRFQESCYLFPDRTFNFNDAEHHCFQYRSKLVHIESETENTFIKNQMRILKDADYWIGLTASKDWKKWIWLGSNTEAMFTDWSSKSPNNYQGNQSCVFMERLFAFQWNDFWCNKMFKAVCEKNQSILA